MQPLCRSRIDRRSLLLEPPLSPEDALQDLEEDAAKDHETEEDEPDGRNGRLLHLLGPRLPVGIGLATAGVLVLDELCVRASLLGCLGHCEIGICLGVEEELFIYVQELQKKDKSSDSKDLWCKSTKLLLLRDRIAAGRASRGGFRRLVAKRW